VCLRLLLAPAAGDEPRFLHFALWNSILESENRNSDFKSRVFPSDCVCSFCCFFVLVKLFGGAPANGQAGFARLKFWLLWTSAPTTQFLFPPLRSVPLRFNAHFDFRVLGGTILVVLHAIASAAHDHAFASFARSRRSPVPALSAQLEFAFAFPAPAYNADSFFTEAHATALL